MALCFPKDGCAHSNPDCVCVCWLISGWIYFQQAQIFFFFFSVSCKAVVAFFFFFSPLLWADSQTGTWATPAIKILKSSRNPYLTLWWGVYSTNEASFWCWSGGVSLQKGCARGALSAFTTWGDLKFLKKAVSESADKFVISSAFAGDEKLFS